jgi:DNA-directed RNA polymerase subunit K/omega
MITLPRHVNRYEFIAVAALRAQQLLAGSTPRLAGDHSATAMAQMEVADGRVTRSSPTANDPAQCIWQL